jgi:arylsulfatase A-like enzyme
VDGPVSAAVDITATCLAIAGAKPSVPQDGVSLLTTAQGGSRAADRVMVGSCAHIDDPRVDIPANVLVVADRGSGLRKLIRYDATGDDRYEAYDIDEDPDELVNWANDPTRRAERDDLEGALDDALS